MMHMERNACSYDQNITDGQRHNEIVGRLAKFSSETHNAYHHRVPQQSRDYNYDAETHLPDSTCVGVGIHRRIIHDCCGFVRGQMPSSFELRRPRTRVPYQATGGVLLY